MINAGIPDTEKLMMEAGKKNEYVVYPGAGYDWMNQGNHPDDSMENREVRNNSRLRRKEILSGL